MTRTKKFTYTIAAIIAAIVFIFFSFLNSGARIARAATVTSTNYEQSNVLDDLEGSTIDGERFSLKKFNFDKRKDTQLLSFIEFGYSYYSEMQYDYGLYIYVYNPQGKDFEKSNTQNYIQIRFGSNDNNPYNMYRIEFLNESTATDYEGLFLKYKVVLSNTQREAILSTLNSSERVYAISEVGLVDREESSYPNPHANEVLSTYTYSGYSKGYGHASSTESTLTYTRIELTGISPEVHQTYFHTPYTNGDNSYTHDTLYSCYFAVPTELFEANGEIVEIRAKWLKTILNWSFVTNNEEFFNFVYQFMGYDMANPEAVNGGNSSVGMSKVSDKRIYAPDVYTVEGRTVFDYGQYFHPSLGLGNMGWFAGLYWCPDDDILNYRVPAEEIVSSMESYHTDYGSKQNIVIDETPSRPQSGWFYPKYTYSLAPGLNDFVSVEDSGVTYSYSKALFESYDESETVIDIKKDDTFSLHSKTLDQSWWEKLFGGSHADVDYSTRYKDIEAIHIVTKNDFKSTPKLTADGLFFDVSDYDEFKAFYDESTADKNLDGKPDYTVVLLRYDVGKSSVLQCFMGTTNSNSLITPNIDIESGDGYIFKQNAYLGFKVIHLVFENEYDRTVIPVVMSPQTVTSDSPDPFTPYPSSGCNSSRTFSIILIAVGSAVAVIVIVKFAIWVNGKVNQSKKE